MATLTGHSPASTYKQILQVGSSNSGLSASIQYIQDGNGTSSVLGLSTSAVRINATSITINGFVVTISGALTVGGTSSITGTNTGDQTITLTGDITGSGTGTFATTYNGIVPLTKGGAAAAITASDGGIVYSTATTLAVLAGTATASKILLSGSSTTPSWSTSTIPSSAGATANKVLLSDGTNYVLSAVTFPNASATLNKIITSDGTNWIASTSTYADSYTANNLLYASSANTVAGLATANNSIVKTDGSGVPSLSTTLPNAVQDNITRIGTVTSFSSTVVPVANGGTGVIASNPVIQRVSTQTGAVATGTTTTPADDTIPQNTEGTEFMTLAITPKNAANILRIEVHTLSTNTTATTNIVALFQDSTANALAAIANKIDTAGGLYDIPLVHTMTAGTTSATTFKVRIGGASAGTVTFNGSASARLFGGVAASSITITEYQT